MNAIRQTQALNKRELENATPPSASWHADYRDTAWVYIGGLPLDLSEGDVLTIFSQYGSPTHLNLIRDRDTGKTKGFGFLRYEDQRSCDLAVDNLGGADVLGRILRVDHTRYKKRDGEDDDTWRIERLEAEAERESNDKKRASDTEEETDEERRRRKRPRMVDESPRKRDRLRIKDRAEDESDPMRDYLHDGRNEKARRSRHQEKNQEYVGPEHTRRDREHGRKNGGSREDHLSRRRRTHSNSKEREVRTHKDRFNEGRESHSKIENQRSRSRSRSRSENSSRSPRRDEDYQRSRTKR